MVTTASKQIESIRRMVHCLRPATWQATYRAKTMENTGNSLCWTRSTAENSALWGIFPRLGLGLASRSPMAQQPSNLTMHRAPESVWDRQDYEHSRSRAMGMLGFALIAAGTALVGMGYKSQLAALKCRAGAVLPKRSA